MEIIIFLVVAYVLYSKFSGSRRCDVCDLPIKKTYYNWEIEGKDQKLCPKCNTQMERRISKERFTNRFGR